MSAPILSVTVLTCFRGVEEERLEDLRRHPRLGVRLGLDVALGLPGVVYCTVLYTVCIVLCTVPGVLRQELCQHPRHGRRAVLAHQLGARLAEEVRLLQTQAGLI